MVLPNMGCTWGFQGLRAQLENTDLGSTSEDSYLMSLDIWSLQSYPDEYN